MKVEIKIKIGEQEVSMEEARKIYNALRDLFEIKAAPKGLDDLNELIKRAEKQKGKDLPRQWPFNPKPFSPRRPGPYEVVPDWTWRPWESPIYGMGTVSTTTAACGNYDPSIIIPPRI